MYCRNCGNEILENDKYCFKCGKKILDDEERKSINSHTSDNTISDDIAEEKKLMNLINKIESQQRENNPQYSLDNEKLETKELSMFWWNFWQYIRFPIGLIFSFLNICQYLTYNFDTDLFFFFILDVSIILLMAFSFYTFTKRKKVGYTFFNIFLFVESIYNSAITTFKNLMQNNNINLDFVGFMLEFIIVLIIWGIIWVLPNYIYFKKRKNYFCND